MSSFRYALRMTAIEHTAPQKLWGRGFAGLMVTQIAGAANDNLLKAILMVAVVQGSTVWPNLLGDGGTGWVNFMLTAPFVVLLGYAGQISDKYSKNRVVVATRIIEIPIAILALIGFVWNMPYVVIAAFILLCSESAFFSPSKYGVIQEYVGTGNLSKANGLINGSTNVAIIAGSAIGPLLLQKGMMWAGVILVIMAVIGCASSLVMSYVPPVNPTLRWSWNPFKSYIESIRSMRSTGCNEQGRSSLWYGVLAWSVFFMIAIVIIAIVPEYKQPLGLDDTTTGYLLAAMGVGIGIGCLTAAACSGNTIRMWFVPAGGIAMGCVLLVLGSIPMESTHTLSTIRPADSAAVFQIDTVIPANAKTGESPWVDVHVENSGKVPLEISNVLATCDCEADTAWSTDEISPGSKGEFKINLSRVATTGGPDAWTGVVTFVDGVKHTLMITIERPIRFWVLWGILVCAGIFGGFFIVPLQALQQAVAIPEIRARVLGTANALCFLFMALASSLYAIAVSSFGITPFQMLLVGGVGVILLALWLMTWARVVFDPRFLGTANISE